MSYRAVFTLYKFYLGKNMSYEMEVYYGYWNISKYILCIFHSGLKSVPLYHHHAIKLA